jgi:hypothetical protein
MMCMICSFRKRGCVDVYDVEDIVMFAPSVGLKQPVDNFLALFTIMGRPAGQQKIKENQMPKKMIELQEALKALNGDRDVRAEDITKMSDKTLRNRAQNAMVRTLPPDQKISYSKCASDKERHQWVAEYILDPQKVKCQGATCVSRTSLIKQYQMTIWESSATAAASTDASGKQYQRLGVSPTRTRNNTPPGHSSTQYYAYFPNDIFRGAIQAYLSNVYDRKLTYPIYGGATLTPRTPSVASDSSWIIIGDS